MIFSSDALALLDMGDMFVLLDCQILVRFLLGLLRTSHLKEGQCFGECVIVLCSTQNMCFQLNTSNLYATCFSLFFLLGNLIC